MSRAGTPEDAISRERFLSEVAKHTLTVKHDDGLYRHLTLKDPQTSNRYFHITTQPGYLAISGDMGCYVFARLPDMFEFFRGKSINPQYWAEKLSATSSHEQFSETFYRDAIKDDFARWEFTSPAQRRAAWQEVEEELLRFPDDNDIAVRKACDYRCSITGNTFADFWDHNTSEFTHHFLWCCHAVQWAIGQYDRAKAPAEGATT